MNENFSSRVFEANVERSKKFKVDIDNDEKKAYDGKVEGVGLSCGCRVISVDNNANHDD